jgi:hypothetical protein
LAPRAIMHGQRCGAALFECEYTTIDLNDLPPKVSELDLLDDAGTEGRELVVITPNNNAYLKR